MSLTRVAVVQIDFLPAIRFRDFTPLEDPLFTGKSIFSLLPTSGQIPTALHGEFKGLRGRLRDAYCDQLLIKVQAILAQCLVWQVEVVVFPEYSLPWEILPAVLEASGKMIVVAGTHMVEPAGKRQNVYERLGWPRDQYPQTGQAVAPVFMGGRMVQLVAKLSASRWERGLLNVGDSWSTVPTPAAIRGPMGVLICLDFLFREGSAHRKLVAPHLEECRFLAIPSLTPTASRDDFESHAWEEARRYGRPVLFANAAASGGTSIFVDEKTRQHLSRFPDHVGLLERGEEGLVVADVDLGFTRAGRSARFETSRVVQPFAQATLVYRSQMPGDEYAMWLEQNAGLLDSSGDEALEQITQAIEQGEKTLLDAAALGAAASLRKTHRLLLDLPSLQGPAFVAPFLREVVLPPEALPLKTQRAALARAAGDEFFTWQKIERDPGLAEVSDLLRKAGDSEKGEGLTQAGAQALARLRKRILTSQKAQAEEDATPASPQLRIPREVPLSSLGLKEANGLLLSFASVLQNPGLTRSGLRDHDMAMREDRVDSGHKKTKLVGVSQSEQFRAEEMLFFAVASGWLNACPFGFGEVAQADAEGVPEESSRMLTLAETGDGYLVLIPETFPLDDGLWGKLQGALEEIGVTSPEYVVVGEADLRQSYDRWLQDFEPARAALDERFEQILDNVEGVFVPARVRAEGLDGDGEQDYDGEQALDKWLAGDKQAALLLGSYGSGKSVLVCQWARSLWNVPRGIRPIVCNLAGAPSSASATAMLLKAAGLEANLQNAARLALLIESGRLLPCFDGFDEMATRISSSELASRMKELLATAQTSGRVLVSSRDNYFPSEPELRSVTSEALHAALGTAAGLQRLDMLLFDDRQREDLVRKVLTQQDKEGEVQMALDRIAGVYDLNDLVTRPLLLGMVLRSLGEIDTSARVGPAEVYEAYLEHWLRNTEEGDAEGFTNDQKKEFAEALADQLWRSGQHSCTWEELQQSVRARLAQHLPRDLSLDAAFLEIQGGAFFVREGEDRFRFAHKSFLEYFLARGLVRTLVERPGEALDTQSLSPEVLGFLQVLFERAGDPATSAPVEAVQTWLRVGREGTPGNDEAPEAIESQLDRTARAATNALRLLHAVVRESAGRADGLLEQADLRRVDLSGESLVELVAPQSDWRGARLVNCQFQDADLQAVDLRGAQLNAAAFRDCDLHLARFDRADLTFAQLDGCRLDGCNFEGARLVQSAWSACRGLDESAAPSLPRPFPLPPGGSFFLRGDRGRSGASFSRMSLGPRVDGTSAEVEFSGSVQSVAFDPSGGRLASCGNDGKIRFWDIQSGAELVVIEGHEGPVRSVAFDPSGGRLASGGDDGKVRLWDSESGAELAAFEGQGGWVKSVAFDPSGGRLASGGDDGMIRLWDIQSGAELAVLEGHVGWVDSMAYDPSGRRLASCGQDGEVRLWDTETGVELAVLGGHMGYGGWVESVAFDPSGRRLASCGQDGTIRLWDTQSGAELAVLKGHERPVLSVAFDPSGGRLASGGRDDKVRLWDTQSGVELAVLEGHEGPVWAVAFSPAGGRLASGGQDGRVRLWDTKSRAELAALGGHGGSVSAVAFAPSGGRLASCGQDGTIRLWDTQSGAELAVLKGHERPVLSVAFDPSGGRLASCGQDGGVRLWDTQSGAELAVLEGHEGWVRSVAFDPVGERLASCGRDGKVRLWDTQSGAQLAAFEGHERSVWSVAFDPSGGRLASGGGGGEVRLWDVRSGTELAVLDGRVGPVSAVAFDPSGGRLASCGNDGKVRLWDVQSGAELAVLDGHEGPVSAVAFDPSGGRLASCGNDGKVRLWDSESGAELAVFEGQGGWVGSVAFDMSGGRLASGGEDGKVRLWDAKSGIELATFEAFGDSWLSQTPEGLATFEIGVEATLRLVSISPGAGSSRSSHFFPSAGFPRALHDPEAVAAALRGEMPSRTRDTALAAIGWNPRANLPRTITLTPSPAVFSIGAPSIHVSEVTNPFIAGKPLAPNEPLPVREEQVNEIAWLLGEGQSILLEAPRRAGKTSLLRRLGFLHSDRFTTLERILTSCERLRNADDLAAFLLPEIGEEASPRDALSQRLQEMQPPPLLLLDEIAGLAAADPHLFPWLRGLSQSGVPILFAGTHGDLTKVLRRAQELAGSSFGNDLKPVPLEPFTRAQAIDFLVDTAPPDALIERDGTARWIVDLVGTWPFYLQVLGYEYVRSMRAGDRLASLKKEGVARLYEKHLLREYDAKFGDQWSELPGALQALLLEQPGVWPDYHDQPPLLRHLLRDAGLFAVVGGWLHDPPFLDWIRRNARELRAELSGDEQ